MYCSSSSSRSLLLPLRTSTSAPVDSLSVVLNKFKQTQPRFLPLAFFSLVCPLRNHVISLLSHQSLSVAKIAGILNKVYYPCYNGSVLVVIKVKPRFTDTRLIQTPHYYGQFALSLGKESPFL